MEKDRHCSHCAGRRLIRRLIMLSLWAALLHNCQRVVAASFIQPPIVLTVEGTNVFIRRFTTTNWVSAFPQQVLRERDRGRTGADGQTH